MSKPILGIIGGGQLGSMLAIGEDGAINAALLAASIIGLSDSAVKKRLNQWRQRQSKSVKKKPK